MGVGISWSLRFTVRCLLGGSGEEGERGWEMLVV